MTVFVGFLQDPTQRRLRLLKPPILKENNMPRLVAKDFKDTRYARRSDDGFGSDADDYRDTDAYKEYAKLVFRVLLQTTEPLTIRAIHEQLGDAANKRYTADALDNPAVEQIISYVDRYAIRTNFVKDLRHRTTWNGKVGIEINPENTSKLTPFAVNDPA